MTRIRRHALHARLALLTLTPCVALVAHAEPAAPAPAAATPTADAEQGTQVRFRNAGPAVTVRVEGGAWQPLAPQASIDVEAAAGATALRYEVAHGYDWQYGGEVDLQSAEARLVVIEAPAGHVMLTNRSDEPRDVVWAGRPLGRIGRDQTRLFGPLAVGEHELVATGARSRVAIAERVTLRPGGRIARVLDAVPIGLPVRNPTDEPVRVLVDQRDHGVLEPRAEATLLGLAPGEHLVVLRGVRTGRDWRGEAMLRSDGRAEQATAAVAVQVVNRSGEILRLPPELGGLHDGPLRPGDDVRMILPGRPIRIRLIGDESGLTYTHDVHPDQGREQRWEIDRPGGIVALQNATGDDAELFIDRAPAIRLAKNARLRVRGVPAGRVRIVVHPLAGEERFERVIRLEAGGEVAWRVRAGAATLVIHNEHSEPVELSIDGTPRGRVAGGERFRVADITPGLHEILALTLYSKHREAIRARVVDGKQADVRLRPRDASVLVRVPGDAPARVLVDGALVGEVAAGHEKPFLVASGRRVVEVRDDKGRVARFAGNLAPGQALPMAEPARPGVSLLLRNVGAATLHVQVDGRGPWVALAAGAELRRDDIGPGEHLVHARGDGEGSADYRRRITLREDGPEYVVEFGR